MEAWRRLRAKAMLENAGANSRFTRMMVAFETGWSLEYLDTMLAEDWIEVEAFLSARAYLEERANRRGSSKG